MNNISVSNLSKSFQNRLILKDISFTAANGTVTTVLGESGAGKTTLFRVLAGLEAPDHGKINLNGKRVGLVFQKFCLWSHMSVLENCILAPMKVLKASKLDAMGKAKDLLHALGIDQFEAYPNTLSGGEQQRVAIARTLLMQPDILLFDEPTSSLDPERTDMIAALIRSFTKEKMIVLVITHDRAFSKTISDQILVLDKGLITKTELCHNRVAVTEPPSNRFVNSFDHSFAQGAL